MAILNKNNLKDIKEVLTTNVYINDKCVDITIKCWLNYGVYEEYTVARVYNDYTMTYINGVEKEYKRRKPALNAILKTYNTLEKMDNILNFKAAEIIENEEIVEEIETTENNSEDVKESYTVGNICFNSYNEAYEYCIASDFDPDTMIEGVGITPAPTNNNIKIKEDKIIRLKIKSLDSKINRLLDKRYIVRDNIIKQGIKFNDRDNELIKQLNSIDNILDGLEEKIDTLKEELREVNNKHYKEYISALKEEYGNNKYKIIDNSNRSITYKNNLKDYLYNSNYTVKLILDNIELCKQGIGNSSIYLFKDSFTVLEFQNNDTINNIIKKEIYSLNTNQLLYKELNRDKRGIHLIYNNKGILNINGNSPTIDTLNKAIEVFKSDIEILEVLENYTPTKSVKMDNKSINKLDMAIKDYSELINKFKDLKTICSNLEYYNNLYKNNIKSFYKKYKTNRINFSNYLENYKYLQWLLNNKDNIKDYKYKAPLKVVYTTKYRNNI